MKKIHKQIPKSPIVMTGAECLAIWHRAQAVLKKKTPAMLKELKKIRREWDDRDRELRKIWLSYKKSKAWKN